MPRSFPDAVIRMYEAMNELVPDKSYPASVLPIPAERIGGTAFFPGGCGLYLEGRDLSTVEFPVGGVMVLGHNFDSEAGFNESVKDGKEKLTTGTWGRLIDMLKDADVPVDRCFFTNAFMGLCEGRDNKKYAGRTDQRFRTACLNFLSHQIHIQRPRLIVTLGRFVPPLLAYASSDLKAWADRCRGSDPMLTRKNMDENPILRFAQFDIGDGRQHGAAVVAISHPSDQRNGRARHPSGFPAGDAGGEIELIRAGWREPIL